MEKVIADELVDQTIADAYSLLGPTDHLLFLVVAGSYSYGLARPGSDLDIRGVFLKAPEKILSIQNYPDELSLPTGDFKLWSLKKYYNQLVKGNPQATEMLFSPEDCILYSNPLFAPTISSRNVMVSMNTVHAYRGMGWNQHLSAKQVKDILSPTYKKAAKHFLRLAFELDNILENGRPDVRITGNQLETMNTHINYLPTKDMIPLAESIMNIADDNIENGCIYPSVKVANPEGFLDCLHASIYLGVIAS